MRSMNAEWRHIPMTTPLQKNLLRLMRRRAYTTFDLAAELEVSQKAVSYWLHGSRSPQIKTFYAMSRLFGVSMDDLWAGDVE